MKKLFVIVILVFGSFSTFAFDPSDAIKSSIKDEYGDAVSGISVGTSDALSFINNYAMNTAQGKLKNLLGERVRDYEVLLKVHFLINDVPTHCRALVKSKSQQSDIAKVFVSRCDQSFSEVIRQGEYTGPKFLKQVKYQDGQITDIESLPTNEY